MAEQETPSRALLRKGDFEANADDESEDIPISVYHPKTGAETGQMVFRIVKMGVIDQYRDINAGTGAGRRKPDKPGARAFLFRKAFKRFDPLDPEGAVDIGGHKNDCEFFIAECPKLVDRLVIEYLNATYPDVDLGK